MHKSYHYTAGLLMLTSLVILSSALVTHRHHNHILPLQCSSIPSQFTAKTSPESNFWVALAENITSTSSNALPAIYGLDKETGRLPPGAYQSIDGEVATAPCYVSMGIQPPPNANTGDDVWRKGVLNCQKMIDSGFNTFRISKNYGQMKGGSNRKETRGRNRSLSSIALGNQKRNLQIETRHKAEAIFYHTLRQNTPASVLRSCTFMVNLEIPSILSKESGVYKNGMVIRKSISDALLRTRGESLDSIVLEYSTSSPYHLDVLNTLFEMKCDGLIHSISARNFPQSLIQSAYDCGFSIQSNDIVGNLLNTKNLETKYTLDDDEGCSRLISRPLGGGILTQKYRSYSEMMQTPSKMPLGTNLERYRTIMDNVEFLALKHEVSVETISLRWLLQLNNGNSISVGTLLGMDLAEEQGGQIFNRHRILRQIFTFELEEEDMQLLARVSGYALK